MKIFQRHILSLVTCTAISLLLIGLTIIRPPGYVPPLFGFIILLLIVYTSILTASFVGEMVSFTPMITVAGFLVVGLIPVGWAAFIGALIYSIIRQLRSNQSGVMKEGHSLNGISLVAANMTAKTTSILIAGAIYQYTGGVIPLIDVDIYLLLPLLLLIVTYFAFNSLITRWYISIWETNLFPTSESRMYRLIMSEGGPLIFSPLLAVIITNLGMLAFTLTALAVAAIALIIRNFAITSYKLDKQLKVLESLKDFGQELSASLDLKLILMTVYTHVTYHLPAECFYIALYNEENNEVSYPLVIEHGQQVKWSSRRHSQGLTEHIIRTRSPLLRKESIAVTRSKIDVNRTKRPATSWLGVPIISGDELLGIIAVQSSSSSDIYDLTHQAVLNTIASQAAVAIQKSRIYTRTDSALKRRVQELDSILRIVGEGVLLVDLKFKVLTVNRTLAGIVGTTRDELKGISIIDFMLESNRSLIDSIGYTKKGLLDDCEDILSGEYEIKRHTFSLSTRSDKRIERTLTPVRDLEDKITAWLFVFRDVTEEFELMRLREDMMHTLIHDLRSPLAVVKGSLEVIKLAEVEGHQENIDELLRLALIGTERMLRLINNLLDASRLEEGKMILDPQWVSIKPLLENVFRQVTVEANRVNITIEVSADEDLPSILVDQGHLERILNNLLDNAIKFTPDGGRIDLFARIEPDYSPASIIIGVSDTGPGIPEEIQSQLFKKFKQLGMIQGRRTGSGVGLHYCKLAIEAHGGQIWVESQVGRGSTFFIQLPIAP